MTQPPKVSHPRRGEVYLVNLDPTIGAEIKKTRPALILQNDVANRHSPITIVASITSQADKALHPSEVLVIAPEGGLRVDSVVVLNQIRSIDMRRLIKRLGVLKHDTMRKVERALLISFGVVRL